MKKYAFIIVMALVIILAVSLVACDGMFGGSSGGANNIYGKYYEYENGVKNPDTYIELKTGKKWTDGTDSGDFTIDGNSITLLSDGEELMTGTVENGVLSLELWGVPAGDYYKDGAYPTSNGGNNGGGSQTPVEPDDKASIVSIVNGSVEGLDCYLEVSPSTVNIDLSGSIEVSKDSSWQLYADVLGQQLIPTKYAANLVDGDNIYYVVVNSADGTVNRTYTLHIWRNFNVEVVFYSQGEIVKMLTKTTHTNISNDEFVAVSTAGYTFTGWSGHATGEDYYITGYDDYGTLARTITFEAQFTANKYTITLDDNGGTCSTGSVEVTYGKYFEIPVPTRTGYTFDGWEYNGTKITTSDGSCITGYAYSNDIIAKAKWSINSYQLTVNNNDADGGTVSSSGTRQYNSSVTITATPYSGYTFAGWYQGWTKVSDSTSYTFTMPANDVTYTAKWKVASEMQNFNFTSTRTTCTITGIKDKSVTSIVVPDYVTEISKDAFKGCTNLTSVTIGDSVTTIGSSAFYECYKLVEVYNKSNLNIVAGSTGYGYVGYYALNVYTEEGGSKLTTDENGFIIYTNGADKILVDYVGEQTDLVIPYGITEIHIFAFAYCDSLTNIDIPDTVITIGKSAFISCDSLTSIDIPDSVTSIGSSAFGGCSSLTSITIPFVGATKNGTSNTHFGYIFGASSYNYNDDYVPNSLKEMIITGGTTIGYSAFYDCTSLTSVTIGDSVTTIGERAFYGCDSLTSVTIGSGVTTIGYSAFYSCDSLTSIVIPDSVTSIGSSAFRECDSLTSIVIPDSVTIIASYAFYSCDSLTSVTFGDNSQLTTIGYEAFYSCDSLTSVTFGDNSQLTTIGSRAFAYCDSLTSVTFEECSQLESIGDNSFAGCSSLTDIVIPDSVTTIGDGAFLGCSSLTSVTIGSGVTTISYRAFEDCSSLTDVYYTGDIAGWCGITFKNYDANPMYYADSLYIDGKLVEGELAIPDSVTTIGDRAFLNCDSLTSVTFGDNSQLTTIGCDAFSHCSSLTSVTIGDSVTTIGSNAFYDCDSLTSVTIGDSVTTIGDYAFWDCYALAEVYNYSSLNIKKGSSDYGYVAYYALDVYTTDEPSKLTTDENEFVIHTDGNAKTLVRYIGTATSIVIPNSVTSIGADAFMSCASLTSITIPDSVTSIGEYAFSGCKSLTSIVIPDSVTTIGKNAFYGCDSLTSVTFEDPNGWYVTTTEGATSGTDLTLTNPSTNAKYLKSTYFDYYWYKK